MSGLPWAPLNANTHFGLNVKTTLRVQTPENTTLETEASILREFTSVSEHMALRFHLTEKSQTLLEHLISKHGFFPTEYIRKYPRIPSMTAIETFPTRALVHTVKSFSKHGGASLSSPIIFDVENLSPNGLLIKTENTLAALIETNTRIGVLLDPRGWFPSQVHLEGLVCRIMHELDPITGNTIRHLGVKIMANNTENATLFLKLLEDVLKRIRAKRAFRKE